MQGLRVIEGRGGWTILAVHYSADPTKDAAWKEREFAKYSAAGRPEADWNREMELDFGEQMGSAAYWGFKRSLNCQRGVSSYYNPRTPLILCCDFNVDLMAWPVLQCHRRQWRVLTEIAMEPGNVPAMARLFRNRFPTHLGELWVYGDASGNARSRMLDGNASEYDVLRMELAGYSAANVEFRVPTRNPQPRARLASVNRVLRGTDDWEPLLIDEDECPHLIADLEQVVMNRVGTDVQKVSDPEDPRHLLTHTSDALGYFCVRERPVADEVVANIVNKRRNATRMPLPRGGARGDIHPRRRKR